MINDDRILANIETRVSALQEKWWEFDFGGFVINHFLMNGKQK